MRLTLMDGLLKNLKGEIPSYMRREFLTKEIAYKKLKEITGQDFGMDAKLWEQWITTQESAGGRVDRMNIAPLPHSDKISNARAFVHFLRNWFPRGLDVMIYWANASGDCRRFCEATGENSLVSTIVFDEAVSGKEFEDLLERVVELNAMNVPAISPRLSTAHSDDRYSILLPDGDRHSFFVPGSVSSDENVNKLRKMLTGIGLLAFYRASKSC